MTQRELKKRIDIAAGRLPADLVIQNCRIVNVFTGEIEKGDIALCDGMIAGIGNYHGFQEENAGGAYAIPGLIEGHIHIESSFVTPEEISRLLVPHGTTTIIADPHEIVNVCGRKGMEYMLNAARQSLLDIRYMIPSCVPSTPYEHSGAAIHAADMEQMLENRRILGIGEYMNVPGVINAFPEDIDKLLLAQQHSLLVDGHSPNLSGKELNAYISAGIHTDHECSTVEEMRDRIRRGMYVLLRQGSACHNLYTLLKGIDEHTSRYCLLCSDDRQPKTIFEKGHLEEHLRICVKEGLSPVTAIQMATINAAQCYRLYDRGALAPGLRGDIVLVNNLEDFCVQKVWIKGIPAAEHGQYLPTVHRIDTAPVTGSIHVADFSQEKLKLRLTSDRVRVIQLQEGEVITKSSVKKITLSSEGDFRFSPEQDIAKIAVVERHHNTGNVAVALIGGYGIRTGAVALSIAHDSHNIIAVGISNQEIACAVEALIAQNGGIVLINNGIILESMPLPIGGIMSDQSGEWVEQKLSSLHKTAFDILGVNRRIDPLMTLCFMSLPVIPELKITDMGLFDVNQFAFVPLEAEKS